MFFLESKTIPGCLSFCCVIALEYSCHFQTYLWSHAYTQFPFKERKWNLGSPVSCPYEKNSMMVLMKKFQLMKMMFCWSFCILLIHQYILSPVNHVLQLGYWGINRPLFRQGNSLLYIGFSWNSQPKNGIFQWTPIIFKFFILNPSHLLK